MQLPFADFAPPVRTPSRLRQTINDAYRIPEPEAVRPLLEAARLSPEQRGEITATARDLVSKLRSKGQQDGVEGLVKEYALSSQEGVALMCMAEALLRIPDKPTRDRLIRDKIARGDWRSHLGGDKSVFVNAATWGLVVSGRLVTPVSTRGLGASLNRLINRAGEPAIRSGVNLAMELMGEQFVLGETIAEALKRARKQEAVGFAYSYDMLGEAAMTMADADRYFTEYEYAIHAIGRAAAERGVHTGPGISIKLSALHPRYSRAQAERVMEELLPRARALAVLAKEYDIGLNIDAEEADRLDLSLDILEALALDPDLAGWHGLGYVVQAYGKRSPFVIDWLVDLAQRSGHRIMIRLVKGAYWDSEVKRTQVEGLEDFPVFTRKAHTDVCYLACARKLLGAREAVFPQFATHNAHTVAAIHHMAGDAFSTGDFEFQCLHGMGEALYEEVVGKGKLNRPCRIYAPVGTHETLLPYLVRRLLENGANSSFVNRIWDKNVAIDELIRDPVELVEQREPIGAPHEMIALPSELYRDRRNSRGLDLSDESTLARLSGTLAASVNESWEARPAIPGLQGERASQPIVNPADHRDIVGKVYPALPEDAQLAASNALAAGEAWAALPVTERAAKLEQAADLLEARGEDLLGLIVREAGKSVPNSVPEVREAVDFLRYYAQQARENLEDNPAPLGPVVCISPWNFPLAIFTGQIAAALVAGNTVLAKPAEETPLIAAQAVAILHEAGIPEDVLQFLPGDGPVGAALVAAPETAGVLFTGSFEVAKLIQQQVSRRLLPKRTPIRLIAETGGQNAMIVDSSAMLEQVVRDVLASAFDSAGQRCSALRVLCVQEDIADELLAMLQGAMEQLVIAPPDALRADVGPVISAEARDMIRAHVEQMTERGHKVSRCELGDATEHGTFVAPTVIEIDDIGQLEREVFGPVLHVLRYSRRDLPDVLGQIKATGYGLSFGLHSRIDETIGEVIGQASAGNIYINRNVIGAIVGVQPFGGHGLSGTGPKAGGPLYLGRLVSDREATGALATSALDHSPYAAVARWKPHEHAGYAESVAPHLARLADLAQFEELAGPVGEMNLYGLRPRGRVLVLPKTGAGLREQLLAAFATGNVPVLPDDEETRLLVRDVPELAQEQLEWVADWTSDARYAHVLIEDGGQDIVHQLETIAAQPGPIPIVQLGGHKRRYRREWMVDEIAISIDTTAAGGNASLMAVA